MLYQKIEHAIVAFLWDCQRKKSAHTLNPLLLTRIDTRLTYFVLFYRLPGTVILTYAPAISCATHLPDLSPGFVSSDRKLNAGLRNFSLNEPSMNLNCITNWNMFSLRSLSDLESSKTGLQGEFPS